MLYGYLDTAGLCREAEITLCKPKDASLLDEQDPSSTLSSRRGVRPLQGAPGPWRAPPPGVVRSHVAEV